MVGFPLLLIPLAIYNIIAWLMPDVPLSGPLIKLTLVSRVEWQITLSDILLSLGVLLLLLEIVKGARPGAKFLMDHLLSLIVFGAAAAEFVMWPKFGNSTYFLLVLLAMADFFGGVAPPMRRRPRRSRARRVVRPRSPRTSRSSRSWSGPRSRRRSRHRRPRRHLLPRYRLAPRNRSPNPC